MLHLRSMSQTDTRAIAATIARVARAGDVVVLAGEMGAGKTVFAQGFGEAFGVTEPMTSPTFNLVHSHPAGRLTLHHADLYRLGTQHEVADLAFAELAESGGVVIVEWGDVVSAMLGDHLLVELGVGDPPVDAVDSGEDESVRTISVAPVGRAWVVRWPALQTALEGFAC
jgi:tRNA threonylcarbamoyladenosine biosynthesis protein TsaE